MDSTLLHIEKSCSLIKLEIDKHRNFEANMRNLDRSAIPESEADCIERVQALIKDMLMILKPERV